MDYLVSFAISAAGMTVERTRVEVASLNLANAHTVQAPGGQPFDPLRVVAGVSGSFAAQVEQGLRGATLPVAAVEPAGAPPRLVSARGGAIDACATLRACTPPRPLAARTAR